MSMTSTSVTVAFTVYDPEQMPAMVDDTGETRPRYADDVAEELCAVIQTAVTAWYGAVGHLYLASEPDVAGG